MPKPTITLDKTRGVYGHDEKGRAYGSLSSETPVQCSLCNRWVNRGWRRNDGDDFCLDCVVVLEPDKIRKYHAGYVGGEEIARKATDQEIVMLVQLNDEVAHLHNTALELKRQTSNIMRTIAARE